MDKIFPNFDRELVSIFLVRGDGHFGGPEKYILNLSSGLKQKGYLPIIVCINKGNLALLSEANDFTVEVIRMDKNPISAILQFRKLIQKYNPKIIQTHCVRSTLIASFAANPQKIKLIRRLASFTHFDYKNKIKGKIILKIESILLKKRFTKIIAISKALYEYSVKKLSFPPNNVEVIYNGVPQYAQSLSSSMDLSEKYNIPRRQPVVGVIGRLEEEKGHETLILALPQLYASYCDFKLLIIGKGSLNKKLHNLVDKLDMNEKVIFLGFQRNISDVLGIIDVYVQPSLYEGSCMALLEAMMAGKAVVASATGGIVEIVKNEYNGLLTPPGDKQKLATAISRLLRDSELRNNLGLIAAEYIQTEFPLKKMINNTAMLYDKLLNLNIEYKVKEPK